VTNRAFYLALRAFERKEIASALVTHFYNRTHTARALGISRRTLLNKIKIYNLELDKKAYDAACTALPQVVYVTYQPAELKPAPASEPVEAPHE